MHIIAHIYRRIVLVTLLITCSVNLTLASDAMTQSQLYPYLIDSSYVYVDSSRRVVLQDDYSFAYPFNGNYAVAKKAGATGVIDRAGRWILKPKYDVIEIKTIGEMQFFVATERYNTHYQAHKWRLLPNVSLFSSKGPFIATAVSHTKWHVFDYTGREFLSKHKEGNYDDYNKRGAYFGSSDLQYSLYIRGNQLLICDKELDQLTICTMDTQGKIGAKKTVKNVVALLSSGYLVYNKSRNSAMLYGLNGKLLHTEPYSFVMLLQQTDGWLTTPSLSNRALWKHQGLLLCASDVGSAFVPVPESVMVKFHNLLFPLDSLGNTFWLNMGGLETGICSKNGDWISKKDNYRFDSAYGDQTLIYRDKGEDIYYSYKNGKTYPFPKGQCPEERVQGQVWRLVYRNEQEQRMHSIYDAEQGRYLVSSGVYIVPLKDGYYYTENKIYPDHKDTYDLQYIVVDNDRRPISKGDYRFLASTSDPDLVLATPRASRYSFYVIIETGEELRK